MLRKGSSPKRSELADDVLLIRMEILGVEAAGGLGLAEGGLVGELMREVKGVEVQFAKEKGLGLAVERRGPLQAVESR